MIRSGPQAGQERSLDRQQQREQGMCMGKRPERDGGECGWDAEIRS